MESRSLLPKSKCKTKGIQIKRSVSSELRKISRWTLSVKVNLLFFHFFLFCMCVALFCSFNSLDVHHTLFVRSFGSFVHDRRQSRAFFFLKRKKKTL